MTLNELIAEYKPYDEMPEFKEGFVDYQCCLKPTPYGGLKAQAYDRGAECAMRWDKEQALDACCEQHGEDNGRS